MLVLFLENYLIVSNLFKLAIFDWDVCMVYDSTVDSVKLIIMVNLCDDPSTDINGWYIFVMAQVLIFMADISLLWPKGAGIYDWYIFVMTQVVIFKADISLLWPKGCYLWLVHLCYDPNADIYGWYIFAMTQMLIFIVGTSLEWPKCLYSWLLRLCNDPSADIYGWIFFVMTQMLHSNTTSKVSCLHYCLLSFIYKICIILAIMANNSKCKVITIITIMELAAGAFITFNT